MKVDHHMRASTSRVSGVVAPGPRPTKLAAALIATAISIPFLVIVGVIDLLT